METNQYWSGTSSGEMVSQETMLQYLLNKQRGVVILDGYSGCGKTRLLKKLKETKPQTVQLFSYVDIVAQIVSAAKKKTSCRGALLDVSAEPCLIGVEDVDFLRGKEETQRKLAELVNHAAGRHIVILTGNNVQTRTPVLCELCAPEIFIMRR